MDIILLEKIDNIGGIGDRVKVKSGYARNFLIPKGKATLATPENIAKFEKILVVLESKAATEVEAAQQRASKLEGKVITMKALAGSGGKLFGSIGTIDIATACSEFGVEIGRSEVRMPNGPLRLVGEHQIELHLHADVNVPLTVIVESNDPVVAGANVDTDEDSEVEADPDAADSS